MYLSSRGNEGTVANSQNYFTINTYMGLYRYLRLLFGIALAPAIWQEAMTTIHQWCKGIPNYLDDIMITHVTREVHTQNLKNFLCRPQKFRLWLNGLNVNSFKHNSWATLLHLLGYPPMNKKLTTFCKH